MPNTASPYASLFSTRFRAAFQYRQAAWAGVGTQVFFGLVIVSVLRAFETASPGASGQAFGRTASYAWLGQALLSFLPWNPDPEVRNLVRSGDIAMELAKPVDLWLSWFVRALAWRLSSTSLRMLPCILFSALLLPALGYADMSLSPPDSPWAFLAFVLALPGAALLSASITVFFDMFHFRTISAGGATAAACGIVTFCAGLCAPLHLYPEPLASILAASPFAFVTDAPFKLWSGILPPQDLLRILAFQALWLCACVLAGRAWMGSEIGRLEIAGA